MEVENQSLSFIARDQVDDVNMQKVSCLEEGLHVDRLGDKQCSSAKSLQKGPFDRWFFGQIKLGCCKRAEENRAANSIASMSQEEWSNRSLAIAKMLVFPN